jgi:hypothetical protein
MPAFLHIHGGGLQGSSSRPLRQSFSSERHAKATKIRKPLKYSSFFTSTEFQRRPRILDWGTSGSRQVKPGKGERFREAECTRFDLSFDPSQVLAGTVEIQLIRSPSECGAKAHSIDREVELDSPGPAGVTPPEIDHCDTPWSVAPIAEGPW